MLKFEKGFKTYDEAYQWLIKCINNDYKGYFPMKGKSTLIWYKKD